jgi:hypothetical protein
LKAFCSGYSGVPEIRTLFEATYFAGLRRAGMPRRVNRVRFSASLRHVEPGIASGGQVSR